MGDVTLDTVLLGVITVLLSLIGTFFGSILLQIRNELKTHIKDDAKMFLEFTTRITRLEEQ